MAERPIKLTIAALGGQGGAVLALEVIMQDQLVAVLRKHQIDAGPLEVAVEKQLAVRDDDRIRWRVRGVRLDRLDMGMSNGVRTRAVSGKLGVEFAGVIQWPTAMVNKYLIFKV